MNKYSWKEINFQSEKGDWEKFGKNNVIIDLNVFYAKKEKIYLAYVSKDNSSHEKQVILFMIANGGKPKWSKTLTTQIKYEGGKTQSEVQ